MIFNDNERSEIDWDTYESLLVQVGVLSYTAAILLGVLGGLALSLPFIWLVSKFFTGVISDHLDPVPANPDTSWSLRLFHRACSGLALGLEYVLSFRWYFSILKFLTRYFLPVTAAALVAGVAYYSAVRLSLDYLYCVADERATAHYKCSPEEEGRPVTVQIFDRVVDSGLYG